MTAASKAMRKTFFPLTGSRFDFDFFTIFTELLLTILIVISKIAFFFPINGIDYLKEDFGRIIPIHLALADSSGNLGDQIINPFSQSKLPDSPFKFPLTILISSSSSHYDDELAKVSFHKNYN